METKLKEIKKHTSDLSEMKNQYLAERLLRSWKEDFVDEDTGEVIQIERNEILFDKGTFIDQDVLTQINFYLQTEDIKEVHISNQKRGGTVVSGYPSVYAVTVNFGKKKTYYLYADSVKLAVKIATDFLEQKLDGAFSYVSVKELKYSTLIPEIENDEDAALKEFYQVEIEISREDQEPYEQIYILKAKDVEHAKEVIEQFIITLKKENNQDKEVDQDFTTSVLSGKKISCHSIVDYKFSKEYLENQS